MKKIITLYLFIITYPNLTWAQVGPIAGDSLLNVEHTGPRTEEIDKANYNHITYVSEIAGSDETGDGSEGNPWKTIIYALLNIKEESETNRSAIFVSAGEYNHGTIYMQEWVDLFGGFDAENWERNIVKNKTILSGNGLRRVVMGQSNSRIDGFVISKGLSRTHGAGILCDDTSPIITNNVITDNTVLEPENFNRTRIHQEGFHGGGIACLFNAAPVIRNNMIYHNRTSVGTGAGIAFYGWLRIKNAPETRIENNYMKGGLQPVVENNVIIKNISGVNDYSRTRSSSGGGISCAHEARPLIRNNVIVGNEARGRSDAGGIYCEYYSYPLIEGNWILGNICDDDGGGIYTMKLGNPIISNNIIAGNWTHGGGAGGIRISKEGRATILQNLIVYNPGGGVHSVDSYVHLENNLILYNSAAGGFGYSNNFSYMGSSIVKNNIVRDNEEGAINITTNNGPDPRIENNNLDDDWETKGEQNYNRIPLFRKNSIIGEAKEIEFNQNTFVTSLFLEDKSIINNSLNGRIIRVGDDWGVIKHHKNDVIQVWGLTESSTKVSAKFEVLPSFK